MTTEPAEELDAQIAAAFSDDAKSGDAARLLAEVKEATSAAELAAETARKHALDPLLSGDDLKLARREMDDAAFKRDRLQEASAKLAERIEALKALEADRRMQAEHERVLAERNRLAKEMECMAAPIVQIAHLVRHIEACDREIGRLNATSAAKFGPIRNRRSGSPQGGVSSVVRFLSALGRLRKSNPAKTIRTQIVDSRRGGARDRPDHCLRRGRAPVLSLGRGPGIELPVEAAASGVASQRRDLPPSA